MNPLRKSLFRTKQGLDIPGELAVTGTSIIGTTGGGKSSSVLKELMVSALRTGVGMVVFAAKGSDAADVKGWIREAGRPPETLIHFGPGTGHCLDIINLLWRRPGGRKLEEVIEVLRTLVQIANPDAGGSKERFFEMTANDGARSAIVLLDLSDDIVSISTINDFIDSFPTVEGQYATEEYQRDSKVYAAIRKITERKEAGQLSDPEYGDFIQAQHFALVQWPSMYPETRTSVHATWRSFARPFLFSPYREAFCSGKSTFVPEQAELGNVILVDWAPLQHGHTGRIATVAMKLLCQTIWTKRVIKEDSPIILYVSDEAALTLLPEGKDARFAAVCRGSRIASVFVFQSIHNLAEALGEHQPGSKVRAWLGSTNTKVVTRSLCPETNTYFADLVGKRLQMLGSYGGDSMNVHVGASEHLGHTVLPHEFTTLHMPGPDDPNAEAIVYAAGHIFEASGTNYLRTYFTR